MHLSLYKSLHFFLKASPFHIECRFECVREARVSTWRRNEALKKRSRPFRRRSHTAVSNTAPQPPLPCAGLFSKIGQLGRPWWETLISPSPTFTSLHQRELHAYRRNESVIQRSNTLRYHMRWSISTNKWDPDVWHRFKVDRISLPISTKSIRMTTFLSRSPRMLACIVFLAAKEQEGL